MAATDTREWPWGFSPDGRILAMIRDRSEASKVTLWDTATCKQQPVLRDPVDNPRSLAFSPDGCFLAIGGFTYAEREGAESAWDKAQGRLCLWDIRQGREYAAVVDKSTWGITAVAFSPDSKTIATGDGEGNLKFWQIADLRTPKRR
jgi:WD40 repeat protein